MLAVAFQYRETKLWEILDDSSLFAFRLSDGEIGYCFVIGQAERNLSLGFYRGRKGFTSYLKLIKLSEDELHYSDRYELISSLDCTYCEFMQASKIDKETKTVIRNYVETHNLKLKRYKGWPSFIKLQPYSVSTNIIHEKDAEDIIEALHAAIAVAEKLKNNTPEELGFDKEIEYPTMEGGKSVPYLIPNADGTYDWSTTELPAFLPEEYPAIEFENTSLAKEVKKLKKQGKRQIKMIHFPASLCSEIYEEHYMPVFLFSMDVETDQINSIPFKENSTPQRMLEIIANVLCEQGYKPDTIEVADDRTEAFLADFCKKCGMRLTRKKKFKELEEACDYIFQGLDV